MEQAAVETSHLWQRRHALKVKVLSNRLYQQHRARLFDRRDTLCKVATVLAGSAALSRVIPAPLSSSVLAVAAVLSGASLVFRWGAKAHEASKRVNDWISLDVKIEAAGDRGFTEAQVNEWSAEATRLEAGEPAPHPGLWERSYLACCEALGTKPLTAASWWARHRPVIFLP